jgi:signal transduction histidine kinase
MQEAGSQGMFAIPTDPGEDRMISGMRLVLAVAAFVITHIDPTEPSRFAAATYSTLILYLVYSLALHALSLKGVQFPMPVQYSLHWIDAAFYVALIGLSHGTNSIFFVLFFFCIIVASFRWGFAPGMRVTIVSVVLYVIVGYAARPPAPEFDLGRFILRTSALPVLGYMIAHWGGYELRLRRRLALLKEISTLSNPRFGVDRTLGANMNRLRVFYGADQCVVVLPHADGGQYSLRRATTEDPEAAMRAERVSADLVKTLLLFGPEEMVCCRLGDSWWWPRRLLAVSTESRGGPRKHGDEELCRSVAEVLGASSFLTVPMRSKDRSVGRLFLTARKRSFRPADLDFLYQVVDNIMPVLDNIVLVDRMATRAAEEERQRIARDIHDTIIQPYIGLQLGITSIRELCDATNGGNPMPILKERASRLQELAAAGIADLRQYVRRLKYGEDSNGGFVKGLQRYATRFCEATGIEVEVKAAESFHINDRLAAEIFSMLEEALSNIRRHTRALRSSINLKTSGEQLFVLVENETGTEGPPEPFIPRSIAERAASLEGTASVKTLENGNTAVIIQIPL